MTCEFCGVELSVEDEDDWTVEEKGDGVAVWLCPYCAETDAGSGPVEREASMLHEAIIRDVVRLLHVLENRIWARFYGGTS